VIGDDPFDVFVARHQHMVFGVALRLLGQPADAEDMAQTVFLRAYERFDALQGPEAAGWLKTVTTNLCLNHLTRHRSRWVLWSTLARPDTKPEAEWPDTQAPSAEAALLAAETQAALQSALLALPPHQRVPLVLVHFHDMAYDEVAQRLGVPLTKIRSDIYRGRQALRRALTRPLPGRAHA